MKIVKISDGLGNQMFQYAFAKSAQIRNNEPVYLDIRFINGEDRIRRGEEKLLAYHYNIREYGLDNFRISLKKMPRWMKIIWFFVHSSNGVEKLLYYVLKSTKKNSILKNDNDAVKFQENMYVKTKFPCYIEGYFLNLGYFKDIRNTLLKEFRVKSKIHLLPILKKAFQMRNTVSLHIRRGDFVDLHLSISESDYYDRAIAYIKERVDNPIFLIFSDDIKWVKENREWKEDIIYVSELGYKEYEELMIMKHCNHNIIANSTFSYWGAWLNEHEDKTVIVPDGWFPSVIPEEWICM